MARGDTPGNGRAADMGLEAVVLRLTRHMLPGMGGSALVSVRARDLRFVIETAQQASRAPDLLRELVVIRARVGKAASLLDLPDIEDLLMEDGDS